MVFVVNKHSNPLMPCSPCKARKLLRSGKARVLHKTPFTIKLIYGSAGYKQEIIAGLDTGSVTIGCAATANGKVLYQSEVTLRTDITSKMQQRLVFAKPVGEEKPVIVRSDLITALLQLKKADYRLQLSPRLVVIYVKYSS